MVLNLSEMMKVISPLHEPLLNNHRYETISDHPADREISPSPPRAIGLTLFTDTFNLSEHSEAGLISRLLSPFHSAPKSVSPIFDSPKFGKRIAEFYTVPPVSEFHSPYRIASNINAVTCLRRNEIPEKNQVISIAGVIRHGYLRGKDTRFRYIQHDDNTTDLAVHDNSTAGKPNQPITYTDDDLKTLAGVIASDILPKPYMWITFGSKLKAGIVNEFEADREFVVPNDLQTAHQYERAPGLI